MTAHHPDRSLHESTRQRAERLLPQLSSLPFSATLSFDDWMKQAGAHVHRTPVDSEFYRLQALGKTIMKQALEDALLQKPDLGKVSPLDRSPVVLREVLKQNHARQRLRTYCAELDGWLKQARAVIPNGLPEAIGVHAERFIAEISEAAPKIVAQDIEANGIISSGPSR